jgi:hypothetical protein
MIQPVTSRGHRVGEVLDHDPYQALSESKACLAGGMTNWIQLVPIGVAQEDHLSQSVWKSKDPHANTKPEPNIAKGSVGLHLSTVCRDCWGPKVCFLVATWLLEPLEASLETCKWFQLEDDGYWPSEFACAYLLLAFICASELALSFLYMRLLLPYP